MNTRKRWLRRAALALGALLVLAAAALATGLFLAERKMQREVSVNVQAVPYRSDSQALERGRYLYASRGCVDCHGSSGTGRTFVEDGGLVITGPNITTGPNGVVSAYQPVDWVRAIRHGVTPQGRAIMVMPSEDYNRFTDDDLAALVAYTRSLPPATGEAAVVKLPLPVKALYGFGAIQDAAARIDHSLPPQQPVPEGVTVEHGRYVANMCIGCHGAKLQGGKIPGGPPDWPPASRLAAGEGSVMGRYPTAEVFIEMFRTGKRPDGTAVAVMPFESLREMSEVDLRALFFHLSRDRSGD